MMESDVFAYFVAIGAGLSFGLSLGLVPAAIAIFIYRIIRRMRSNVHSSPKARR